jgi:hypothetical protein
MASGGPLVSLPQENPLEHEPPPHNLLQRCDEERGDVRMLPHQILQHWFEIVHKWTKFCTK